MVNTQQYVVRARQPYVRAKFGRIVRDRSITSWLNTIIHSVVDASGRSVVMFLQDVCQLSVSRQLILLEG